MNAARFSTWQISAAAVLICAALSAGAWFGLIAPAIDARQHVARQRHELADRQHKALLLTTELKADRKQIKIIHEALTRSRLHLNAASAMNDRIARLNDLATSHGLTIDEIRPDAVISTPQYQIQPLRLTGTGPYPRCVALLHQLHETYPDLTVKSLDVSAVAGRPNSALSFHLELAWYTKR